MAATFVLLSMPQCRIGMRRLRNIPFVFSLPRCWLSFSSRQKEQQRSLSINRV